MTTSPARATPHAPITTYHRMELDRVVSIANSRVAALPGVKVFEIAPMKGDANHREFQTQIRADSVAECDRVELRYSLPLRHSGCGTFDDLAWDLVGRAHHFFVDDQLADLGARARNAIEPLIAAADCVSSLPRLTAVGVSFDFADSSPRISADIEMLGNDLVVGIERVLGVNVDRLKREVARFKADHEKRDGARIRAKAARASGWIDQMALGIVDAAGLGRRATIGMIAKEGWVDVSYRNGEGQHLDATLHQADGIIVGSAMPRSQRWSLKHGDLTIWGKGMPDTLRHSLTGRRVGEVFQNPELPSDAVIAVVDETTSVDPESGDGDQTDGWLRLLLDTPVAEIDETTGDPRGCVDSTSRSWRQAMTSGATMSACPVRLAVTDISSARTPGQFKLTIEPN